MNNEILEVTYIFSEAEDALMRQSVKFTDSLKDKIKKNETLIFNADKVEFSYLFAESLEDTGGWINEFSKEENGSPKAVKFKIRTEDKETIEKVVFIP